MLFANLFKKRKDKKMQRENMKAVKSRISRNQESVYQALARMQRPSNGRQIAAELDWDSASVTNRLAELVKKGRIRIAYRKRGLDGIWRNYYCVSPKR